MITYAVLGLLGILVLVFCILSAKSAKILHVMLMFMVFVALTACIIMLSAAVRTRNDWTRQYEENVKALEEQNQAFQKAIYGDKDAIELERNCLLGIENRVAIELTGQGRVWRSTKPKVAGNDSVEITFGAGATSQIEKDMLLFVFKERTFTIPNDQDPTKPTDVPVATDYIGSVRVTNVDNDKVTAKGQFIADIPGFTDGDAMQSVRWTVFEKMPVDPADALLRAVYDEPFDPADPPASVNFDVDTHVKKMRDKFKELFPKPANLSETQYESIVDDYAFEGMKLVDIQAWMNKNGNGRKFDKGPDEKWYHLTVQEKQKINIQVDNTDPSATLENYGAIDKNTGQAVDTSIKTDNEDGVATLKTGESGYFDTISSDKGTTGNVNLPAINQNGRVANVDYIVYRRALVDIPYRVQKSRENALDLEKRTQDWLENIKLARKSQTFLTAQTNLKQRHIQELSDDNRNLTKDREAIESLKNEMQEQVNNTKQRINDLYADISRKHKLLQRYNQMLLEQEAKNRKK